MIDAERIGVALTAALSSYRAAVLSGDSDAEAEAAGRVAAVVGKELARTSTFAYKPRLN